MTADRGEAAMLCEVCRSCPLYAEQQERAAKPLQIGPLAFDPASGQVDFAEASIRLSSREAVLFHRLARDLGRLVSREALFASLYSLDPDGGPSGLRVIDAFVKTIRRKLRTLACPVEIALVWGRGYMLRPVH